MQKRKLDADGQVGAEIKITPEMLEAGAREVADTKAVYVQAMKRCVGCVHRNANSHCDIYRRHVVEAVPYSEGKTAEAATGQVA